MTFLLSPQTLLHCIFLSFCISLFLKNGPIPPLFCLFSSFQQLRVNLFFLNFCRGLDSHCGSLVLEATALPTESQPLPKLFCLLTFLSLYLSFLFFFKLGHSRPLFLSFCLINTLFIYLIVNKMGRWLNSNLGSLVYLGSDRFTNCATTTALLSILFRFIIALFLSLCCLCHLIAIIYLFSLIFFPFYITNLFHLFLSLSLLCLNLFSFQSNSLSFHSIFISRYSKSTFEILAPAINQISSFCPR